MDDVCVQVNTEPHPTGCSLTGRGGGGWHEASALEGGGQWRALPVGMFFPVLRACYVLWRRASRLSMGWQCSTLAHVDGGMGHRCAGGVSADAVGDMF